MTNTLLIILMGVGVYSLRMTGLLLPSLTVPQRWEEAFRFVPIALISALVTVNLWGGGNPDARQVAGALAGAAIAWRTRKMWACIAGGMLTYWLLRLI
jgi:branched-subunit amino acid transport protein